MHAQERRGKNRSIIERADLFRVWKHRTKERERERESVKWRSSK